MSETRKGIVLLSLIFRNGILNFRSEWEVRDGKSIHWGGRRISLGKSFHSKTVSGLVSLVALSSRLLLSNLSGVIFFNPKTLSRDLTLSEHLFRHTHLLVERVNDFTPLACLSPPSELRIHLHFYELDQFDFCNLITPRLCSSLKKKSIPQTRSPSAPLSIWTQHFHAAQSLTLGINSLWDQRKAFSGPWPSTLTRLSLSFEWNGPLNDLPATLTHLTVGYAFDHPVDQLPLGLTHFHMKPCTHNEFCVGKHHQWSEFSQSWEQFPSSLRCLKLLLTLRLFVRLKPKKFIQKIESFARKCVHLNTLIFPYGFVSDLQRGRFALWPLPAALQSHPSLRRLSWPEAPPSQVVFQFTQFNWPGTAISHLVLPASFSHSRVSLPPTLRVLVFHHLSNYNPDQYPFGSDGVPTGLQILVFNDAFNGSLLPWFESCPLKKLRLGFHFRSSQIPLCHCPSLECLVIAQRIHDVPGMNFHLSSYFPRQDLSDLSRFMLASSQHSHVLNVLPSLFPKPSLTCCPNLSVVLLGSLNPGLSSVLRFSDFRIFTHPVFPNCRFAARSFLLFRSFFSLKRKREELEDFSDTGK